MEETEDPAPVVSAVTALQERIDALPGADALAEMSADKQNEVYAEVCDIYDAIDELDAEEAGALDVSALEEVAAFFTQQIMPLDSKPTGEMSGDCSAEGSNVKWKLTQNDDGSTYTLTISGTGAMADYTNPTKPTAEGANIAPWYLALTADSETNAIPITEIIIGEEVTGLGDWAFAYTQIEDASFAEGVKEYGVRIYSKCPKLTTVDWTNFKPEKVWLDETDKIPYSGAAVPGNMFDQVSTLCNSKLDGKTYTDRLVLPAEVTAVGTSGFYGTGFTTVNFDNDLSGVKQIGYYSFSDMAKLEEVTIPGSMTFATKDRTDGNSSFKDPYGASYAFSNDKALKTVVVEEGIKELPGSIFPGCSALETVSFPSTLTKIGHKVFDQNIKLCAVDLSKCTETVALEESFNCYQNGGRPDIDICTFYVSNASVIEPDYTTMGGKRFPTFSNIAVTNGGTFADDTKFTAGQLATPTKDGYEFQGWYTKDGTKVDTVRAGETYYAKWRKPATLTTNIGEQKFVVGTPTEFTFTTTANDDVNVMVVGTSNFSDASAIEKLEYYEVKDNNWYELTGDFGPATGFLMANATSTFRVTFKKGGDYTFTASMKKAGTGEVLCSTEVNFSVAKATQAAPAAPTLKTSNYTSITLNAVAANANGAAAQYSKDGGKTWQDSPEFTGLTAGTAYTFAVRYAETDAYAASDASTTAEFSTLRRSSGGSSSSSSPSNSVTVSRTKNGDVTVSPKTAKKGDTVTITVTPDKGYELDTIAVKEANGNTVKLTRKSDTQYTFTMPASKVTVEASFTKVEEQPAVSFVDVPTSAYYYDAVAWAVENGITNGTSATAFSPDVSCTRAQMVTFLWRAAGSPKATGGNPFTDVSASAYYYDAVLWAVENGITNGTSATTFSPDDTVTRGQTVTFQHRAAGSPTVNGGSFADVAADAYYAPAVQWAVANGITNGTSNTTFSPDDPCTRGQIVTFMYRDAQ